MAQKLIVENTGNTITTLLHFPFITYLRDDKENYNTTHCSYSPYTERITYNKLVSFFNDNLK